MIELLGSISAIGWIVIAGLGVGIYEVGRRIYRWLRFGPGQARALRSGDTQHLAGRPPYLDNHGADLGADD